MAKNNDIIALLSSKQNHINIPRHLAATSISANDIAFHEEIIASTGYATVCRGMYRGTDVAIKILHQSDESVRKCIIAELTVLSSLRHPRILSLLGVITEAVPYAGSIALVTEYMSRKSLYHVLHDPKTPQSHILACLSQKYKVLCDVADGMCFLHASNVIHRDLKSPNVLIDVDGRAKVCDFGTSALLASDSSHVTGIVGTARWSSPENMLEMEVTAATDVYSFGVIAWEVLMNQLPWHECSEHQIAIYLSRNKKLHLPEPSFKYPAFIIGLLSVCFASPLERPQFSHIYSVLREEITLAERVERSAPLLSPPDHFKCPISHELMEDPVICSDGHTYDRASIEKWFRMTGIPRNPMTNALLESTALRPNYKLRDAINEFKRRYTNNA